jgi:hypothetical protein
MIIMYSLLLDIVCPTLHYMLRFGVTFRIKSLITSHNNFTTETLLHNNDSFLVKICTVLPIARDRNNTCTRGLRYRSAIYIMTTQMLDILQLIWLISISLHCFIFTVNITCSVKNFYKVLICYHNKTRITDRAVRCTIIKFATFARGHNCTSR